MPAVSRTSIARGPSCRLLLIALWGGIIAPHTCAADNDFEPPKTRRESVKELLHGVSIDDPFRWLEDQNSPATRAWIDAQNRYAAQVFGRFPGRSQIAARAAELLKVEKFSLPHLRGERYFFTRRGVDQDVPVICMRQGLSGSDTVLIDPHSINGNGSTTVSLIDVSQDGSLVIYGVRQGGEDEVEVRLFDVSRRADLPDRLPRGRYFGVSLTPDNRTLYYSWHGEEGSRVRKHTLGATGDDLLLFGDGFKPGVMAASSLSHDGRYLIIHIFYGSAAPKSDIYFQDLAAGGKIQVLVNDIDARFQGAAVDDRMFLLTNWQAPRGRMLSVDLKNPARKHWKELVPQGKGVLENFSLVGGKLFLNELNDVVSAVQVHNADGSHVRKIHFPALGSVSAVAGEWDRDEAFFSFSSFHIPSTIYREEVATARQTVWVQPRVPVQSDRFEIEQVWFSSKDKTRVPMFLIHKKGLKRDGQNPTLLSAYGGFNISLTPQFSSRAIMWIEQGGVYAVANLRGGGEFGEDWHKAGMLASKQNVFDDFIAAAEWLIQERYTAPARLAISGGSNGGLLVGAALTQRPELYQAVVCSYPLLDMLRYHRFLVARFWVPEYGSSEDPSQFKVLRAYSPYHNVKAGARYPAVLFITGDSDTRVDPLHARKMAALLQASTGSGKPVLLHYDTKLGHTGARPVSHTIADLTEELSFLFQELGVK